MRAMAFVALVGASAAFDAPIIGEDPRAPIEVDDMLMCESCLAIVDHTMTTLKKKGKVKSMEVAVADLLDEACEMSNMKRFKFIPPKMVRGCNAFKDEYDGQFETPLFKTDLAEIEPLTRETRDNRPKLNALQELVCVETVSVCKGVTVDPPRIEKPKVNSPNSPGVKVPDDIEAERAAAAEAAKKAKPKKKGKKKGKKKPKEDL